MVVSRQVGQRAGIGSHCGEVQLADGMVPLAGSLSLFVAACLRMLAGCKELTVRKLSETAFGLAAAASAIRSGTPTRRGSKVRGDLVENETCYPHNTVGLNASFPYK